MIEYTIKDGREPTGPFRLITTILDHHDASAIELAGAYAQRWEIESAFDELKTHQRGPRAVLRSKSPELVRQEIWGHLCCHYAIRALMLDAALKAGGDPNRVSFVADLRISRRTIAQQGAFSPEASDPIHRLWAHAITRTIRGDLIKRYCPQPLSARRIVDEEWRRRSECRLIQAPCRPAHELASILS